MKKIFNYKNANNYLILMRLNNLTGAWLLLLPALWGVIMFSQSLYQVIWLPVFFIGAIAMRSAGCIINDIADTDIDKKVSRTKNRPLVTGAVTTSEAYLLLISLLSVGFIILFIIYLNSGIIAIYTGIAIMCIVIIYPFAKRFISYPQLVLATVFNAGDLFASIAINKAITLSSIALYIGSAFWIIYYDTIYGHQDKLDDKKIGVHSMALGRFGTKKWLAYFYKLAITFWMIAGALSKLNLVFFLGMVAIFYLLYKQLKNTNLDSPEECKKAFRLNANIGLAMLLIIVLGKI